MDNDRIITKKIKYNLLDLDDTDVSHVCTELHNRFKQGYTQTYLGDVLISVNPGQEIQNSVKRVYPCKDSGANTAPFMLDVARRAYSKILTNHSCCIIPSGMCGSGKSYCCQQLVNELAEISCLNDKVMMKKLKMLNKLLEAFTNAVTDQVHSSSTRCVKMFQLFFNEKGICSGAQVKLYLLETLRLTNLKNGEKSFHIFYYYFSGVDKHKLSKNSIKDPNFHRLSRANILQDFTETNDEESNKWKEVVQCLLSFGISSNEIESLVGIMTSVILLKDLKFVTNPLYNGVSVENEKALQTACGLLGLDNLEKFFLTKEKKEKGETLRNLRNLDDAVQACDGCVCFLYEKMLTWIIIKINSNLYPRTSRCETYKINILDAFGFESKNDNTLEQLLINSFHEKLIWHCNHVLFKHLINNIEIAPPNQDCFSESEFHSNDYLIELLIEPGIFLSIINEESGSIKHSNLDLIHQLNESLKNHAGFNNIKENNLHFQINHTIFPVVYSIFGFIEKNRMKSFENDLIELFNKSEMPFILNILKNEQYNQSKKYVQNSSCSKKDTLTHHFKNNVKELFGELNMSTILIKCINPNLHDPRMPFDETFVENQIRSHNIPKTIDLYNKTFYTSLDCDQFLCKYKLISFPMLSNIEINFSSCVKILISNGLENYFIGKTKIYLKRTCVKKLNELLQSKIEQIKACQAHVRKYLRGKRCTSSINESDFLKSIFKISIMECLNTFQNTDKKYWLKVFLIEREIVVLKCYVVKDELTINNSASKYDGEILGMKSPDWSWMIREGKEIIEELREGLVLRRDEAGNIFAKSLRSGVDMTMGCSYFKQGYSGEITESQNKIFDINLCKRKILDRIRNYPVGLHELSSYCSVSINLHKKDSTANITLFFINLSALDILGSQEVLKQLECSQGNLGEGFSEFKVCLITLL